MKRIGDTVTTITALFAMVVVVLNTLFWWVAVPVHFLSKVW
jgi:hypothetical protein